MSYREIIDRFSPFPDVLPINWPQPGIQPQPEPQVVREYEVDAFIENVFEQLYQGQPDWRRLSYSRPSRFVEDNIADHSILVSRIRECRDAIVDLEAARIRTGLAYSAAKANAQADLELELAKADDVERIRKAAEAKRKVSDDTVLALQSRHSLPGGALNFNERRRRLENQIKVDLAAAHDRALAVMAGLDQLNVPPRLQEDIEFPTQDRRRYAAFDGARFFDDWIGWNQRVLNYVEKLQNEQVLQQVSISLGLKSRFVNIVLSGLAPAEARPYLPSLAEREIDQTGVLVQDLVGALKRRETVRFLIRRHTVGWPFQGEIGSSLALRSIGLTASLAEDQRSKWRFAAILRTPDLTVVTLTNIPLLSEGPAWLSDPAFLNQDPRGKWTLELSLDPLHDVAAGSEVKLDPNQWPLLDLQLHLRVAVMMPSLGAWDPEPEFGPLRFE